jgi:predicted CXXCH cytochrome family protein
MPSGPNNLGTDLRGHHPVSFKPGPSATLLTPGPGDAVQLDKSGQVQCTSCHDPHRDDIDPVQKKFLVKSNLASGLCTSCHNVPYWIANPSSHQSSTAVFDQSKGASTAYTTVADNACESCHLPHGAATGSKLLRAPQSQDCMPCHQGQVARYNIQSDLSKNYGHPVLTNDPVPAPGSRYARCVDCHNPHAARQLAANAPFANGFLAGVSGIDKNGAVVNPVQFEYEVCFKCHADSPNQPQALGPTPPESLRRELIDVNLRRLFDASAASSHPVEGPGKGMDVPSLINGLTLGSVIYCSDCHASDSSPAGGGTGPRGPHGSIYNHVLAANYSTADFSVEGPTTYALCYKCHDRNVLMNPAQSAFSKHQEHVQTWAIPCSACHDSHGVSTLQGNPVNNAHLVNFDVSIVDVNSKGIRQYTSLGHRTGTCSMKCHNSDHDARPY